jgi:hypothetical protein
LPLSEPPRWSAEKLSADRDKAEAEFILSRTGEGSTAYYAAMDRAEPIVSEAIRITRNLREIPPDDLVTNRGLWQTLRYVCAPPISEEDLWTLVGKKFKNVPASYAEKTVAAFNAVLDERRFPWVSEKREPTSEELSLAEFSTTVLVAHESFKTSRRGVSSKAQEAQVSAALLEAGLNFDPLRSPILSLDEIARHSFSRERKVSGAKCDVPIRLKDGRLLALECKVSNGPKNSWKRLQREVGGKSETWRRTFGTQVITGAFLAGVFDLACVRRAQDDQGVSIFWQHDLAPLMELVAAN